jgi:hypothetical protein
MQDRPSALWIESQLPESAKNTTLLVYIGQIGVAMVTGIAGDATLRFPAEIVSWDLLADQSGSIVVDIWKRDYASYPPTVLDTITASAPPTISSAQKARNTLDLHDSSHRWTTHITANDTLRFNVNSVTSIQQVCLALHLHKHPRI